MTQTKSGSSPVYEQVLTASCVLFLKSLHLYAELVDQFATDPTILKNVKIQNGLKNIIATIQITGSSLTRLPEVPVGVELSDQQFRVLGSEITTFAGLLEQLFQQNDRTDYQQFVTTIQDSTKKIKIGFHEAINLFEQVFPGRITRILEANKRA